MDNNEKEETLDLEVEVKTAETVKDEKKEDVVEDIVDTTDDVEFELPPDEENSELANLQLENPADQGLVILMGEPTDVLVENVSSRVQSNKTEFFRKAEQDVGSWSSIASFQMENTRGEVQREMDHLEKLDPNHIRQRFVHPETGKVYLTHSHKLKTPSLTQGSTIEPGSEGLKYILHKEGRTVKRCILINSGFSLDLMTPTVRMIADFIRQINNSKLRLGTLLGLPIYFFLDCVVKQEFLNLLKQIVNHSNLPNWSEGDTLAANIDLADLPALMTHVAALLHPNGFEGFRHACQRPVDADHPNGCDYVTTLTIDIGKLLQTKWELLGEDGRLHMRNALAKNILSMEEIELYRKSNNFLNGTVLTFGNKSIKLRSISILEHLEMANKFITTLTDTLKDPSQETLDLYMNPRSIQQIGFYIDSIIYKDDNTVIKDREMIQQFLDYVQYEKGFKDEVVEPIVKAISDHQCTYPCYAVFECPKCGYTPKVPKGFYVVDPQRMFFTIALKFYQNSSIS